MEGGRRRVRTCVCVCGYRPSLSLLPYHTHAHTPTWVHSRSNRASSSGSMGADAVAAAASPAAGQPPPPAPAAVPPGRRSPSAVSHTAARAPLGTPNTAKAAAARALPSATTARACIRQGNGIRLVNRHRRDCARVEACVAGDYQICVAQNMSRPKLAHAHAHETHSNELRRLVTHRAQLDLPEPGQGQVVHSDLRRAQWRWLVGGRRCRQDKARQAGRQRRNRPTSNLESKLNDSRKEQAG